MERRGDLTNTAKTLIEQIEIFTRKNPPPTGTAAGKVRRGGRP